MNGRIKIILPIILLAAGAFLLIQRNQSTWDPANVVPKSAVFALGIDINSTTQKKQALRVVQEIGKDSGLDGDVNSIARRFYDETGLDLVEDILPLTNLRVVLAMLDAQPDRKLQLLLAVGTKGTGKAERLKEKIIQAAIRKGKSVSEEKLSDARFSRLKDDKGYTYIGVVSQAVVISNERNAAIASVEAAKSKEKSLASVPDYLKASTPDPSLVAYAYASGKETGQLGESLTGKVTGRGMKSLGGLFASAWLQLKADGNGVTISSVCNSEKGSLLTFNGNGASDMSSFADLAPADSGIFIALGDWNNVWRQVQDSIAADPGAKRALERFSSSAKRTVGFDPVTTIENVKSAAVFFVPNELRGYMMPGQVTLILKPSDMPDMQSDLKTVRASMAKLLHSSLATTKVGDCTLNYTMAFPGFPQWADARVDDMVMASLDRRSIERVIDRKDAGRDALSDSKDFTNTIQMLPDNTTALVYINAQSMLSTYQMTLPAKVRSKASSVLNRTGTAALGVSSEGQDTVKLTIVVPFTD